MKKKISDFLAILLLFSMPIIPAGCMKDKVLYTYTISRPIYQSLTQVRATIGVMPPAAMNHPGKIYLKGKYIFINEPEKGIHVIDNSDPSNPKNFVFINIPGNDDLAIKDNTLYADSYGDLLAIDISNPREIRIRKTLENIFENRIGYFIVPGNPDSTFVLTGWETKDTTVNYKDEQRNMYWYYGPPCPACMSMASVPLPNASQSSNGTGGSMARFTLVNDWLYAVSNPNLNIIDVHQQESPVLVKKIQVDWHIETIYPFKDKLFIGANNGVFMYDIQNTPEDPRPAGEFTHVRACDPVIADENYAYVTLSDGTPCLGFDNELEIIDIRDLNSPKLVKTYPMTHPLGLSKDLSLLFLCDEKDGLKVFDAAKPDSLRLIDQFKDANTTDVIAMGGLALVLASEGLFEYDYSDPHNIHLRGKLLVSKN